MKVNLTHISECTIDMVIAKDIVNTEGRIIIKADTPITIEILKKLQKYNIEKVHTYKSFLCLMNEDECTEKQRQYNDMARAVKGIFDDVALGKAIKVTELESMVSNILEDIVRNHDLHKYLKNIRTIDEYTYTHSINVAALSVLLANWLNYGEEQIKLLAQAAILHDVGKIRVPSEILNKPSALTEEEFSIMRQHSKHGYDIICENPAIDKVVANAVLYHHERCDGTGYPDELMSGNIPDFAKIISVCDVYDAMTADRVYRGKLCPLKVLKSMYFDKVGTFDSIMKKLFIKNVIGYFVNEDVYFKDGKTGNIVFVENAPPYSMIIKVGDGVITSDVTVKDEFELIHNL